MKTFNFKFVEKRKLWLLISFSVILIGTTFMISKSFNSTPALNYGIDFVGGNTFLLKLDNNHSISSESSNTTINQIRSVLKTMNLNQAKFN